MTVATTAVHVAGALCLMTMSGCQFDSVAFTRDPNTGICPVQEILDREGGVGVGEECEKATDCAAVCCECNNGREESFAAVACIEAACTLVIENQGDEACAILVTSLQEDGVCPEEAQDGDDPGDDCVGAVDCAGTCCTCEDGVTTFEAAFCKDVGDDEFVCGEAAESCAAALEDNPFLCPN